jgi:hypothetical protein
MFINELHLPPALLSGVMSTPTHHAPPPPSINSIINHIHNNNIWYQSISQAKSTPSSQLTSSTAKSMKSSESRKMTAKDASSLLPDASGKSGGAENKSEDWTRFGKRQILSVGKKKEALRYNDDDDELAVDDGYHSSSDEEDGRTAAGKEKKRKAQSKVTTKHSGMNADEGIVDVASSSGPTAHEKKKKSKKSKPSTEMELGAMGTDAADHLHVAKEFDAGVDDNLIVNKDPQNEETATKKKRKKIRSRQKNIRKDHRAENDKPSHLIVGTNEYCGRPMTKETLQKLGIQSTAKKSAKSRATSDAFDSGEWVGDNQTDGTIDDDDIDEKESIPEVKVSASATRTLTKIGDCLVNDDAKLDIVVDGTSSLTGTTATTSSKTTKKQKRKFKNLLVR